MEDYDRALGGWEISRTKTALLGITLGFAGVAAIAATGTGTNVSNQAASALVALASFAGGTACFSSIVRASRQLTASHSTVAGSNRVKVPSMAYKIDVFNVRSRTA